MFTFGNRVMLGLWGRAGVKPAVTGPVGGSELAFVVTTVTDVDTLHGDWAERGITIAMAPEQLDFGYTFVALDPDGHRIRVIVPTRI